MANMVADGTRLPSESWRRKPIAEWSSSEVQSFLAAVIPGHNNASLLHHWTGKVLASITKDDLRLQVKNEEAANVIWVELRHLEAFLKERATIASQRPEPFSVYVRSPVDAAVELEVLPQDTVAEVKLKLEALSGTPVDMQRLMWNGVPMVDTRTLVSYNIGPHSVILSVPRLNSWATGGANRPPTAGSSRQLPKPTSGIPQPRVPVVCSDIARPFDMYLEFPNIPEYQGFMLAVQRCGSRRVASIPQQDGEEEFDVLFLEVLSADGMRAPVQTRILYDAATEVLKIDTLGDILMQRTKYRVLLHLRNERKLAHLVTGTKS